MSSCQKKNTNQKLQNNNEMNQRWKKQTLTHFQNILTGVEKNMFEKKDYQVRSES